MELHSQIASILEALANAAVAEICKLVDDGSALLHLELSQNQKEKEYLKRKVKLLELQVARYRGSRGRNPDAFPGVRLLGRQQHDGATGTLGPTRNKFLNRTQGDQSLSKASPINLDQDPDQEVVTTTKTESQDPEQRDEDLLIVKVEGAMDTSQLPAETSRDGTAPSEGPKEHMPSGQHNQTEAELKGDCGQEMKEEDLKQNEDPQNLSASTTQNISSPKQTLTVSTAPTHTASRSAFQLPRASHIQDVQQPSCFSAPGNSPPHFPSLAKLPPGSDERNEYHNDLSPAWPWIQGSKMGMETFPMTKITQLMHQGNQHRDETFDESTSLTFSNMTLPLTMATADQQDTPLSGDPQHDTDPLLQLTANPSTSYQQMTNQSQGVGFNAQYPQYHCSFCGRGYAHLCQLRVHERVHTGEKPYQCSQCGKRFGQFCSLKRHQMVHTGVKPHRCPQCGKQFSTANNLKVHQSVHTGEKRFHCSQCGKRFSFLSNLIRHQAIHGNK